MAASEPYSDLELMQQFYTVSGVVFNKDNEDVNASAKYYELLEPTKHTRWGVQIVPTSSSLVVAHRFDGSPDFLPITPEEKIIGVDHEEKYVVIKIESTTESKFQYTVIMDCTSQHFTIEPFLQSIENTLFESMKKDIEKQQDMMQWKTKEGHPLRAKALASRLQSLMHSIKLQVVKNANREALMHGSEVSRRTVSRSLSPGSIAQRTPSVMAIADRSRGFSTRPCFREYSILV